MFLLYYQLLLDKNLLKKKKKKKKLQLKAANQVANSSYRTEKEGLVVWLRWLEILIQITMLKLISL